MRNKIMYSLQTFPFHPTGKVEIQQYMSLTQLLQYHVSEKHFIFEVNPLISSYIDYSTSQTFLAQGFYQLLVTESTRVEVVLLFYDC